MYVEFLHAADLAAQFKGGVEGAGDGRFKPGHLAEVDAKKRVAAAQGVVEEGKGSILVEGDEPERELGHLDGERVLVHPVDAAFADQPHSDGEAFVQVSGQQSLMYSSC